MTLEDIFPELYNNDVKIYPDMTIRQISGPFQFSWENYTIRYLFPFMEKAISKIILLSDIVLLEVYSPRIA
jgi:hypothetical protein